MTLLAVRTDFIEFSGRYDLEVNSISHADAGADKFIRAGQRWLDRTFEIAQTEGRYFTSLAAGAWYSLVPSCQVIHEVWMSNSDKSKWKLEKLTLPELLAESGDIPTDIDNGQSLVWAPTTLRTVPETAATTVVAKYGTSSFTVAVNNSAYNGVLWLPPIDQTTTLEVVGRFYQPTLTLDADFNYWTEQESQVLVMAACRALEQSYRNTAGMQDWEATIKSELLGLEFNLADQESVGITGMEGRIS